MSHRTLRPLLALVAAGLALFAGVLLPAASASAHGFTSVVYADLTETSDGQVRSVLELEYDLLIVSAADAEDADELFQDGTAAFEAADGSLMADAIEQHADTVLSYVTDRYVVSSAGEACEAALAGGVEITEQDGVPYAVLVIDSVCGSTDGSHIVTSTLFSDEEGYVTGTKVVLTYDLDAHSGSAALDADHPSFSTEQGFWERFWEFFALGAEHLLEGIDHILFLLALIVGSRRLREVVLAATAFTLAHSVTFILAAVGVISIPASIVEPIIAFSIAAVGAWYLWRLARHGRTADTFDEDRGPLGLDRAGWLRIGVVFLFGLVHGLGFAGALGIDEPWSWTLLWSLLVFNLGIEVVQLVIIVVLFPVLALLRHRVPRVALWVTGLVAAYVTVMGAIWFVERLVAG